MVSPKVQGRLQGLGTAPDLVPIISHDSRSTRRFSPGRSPKCGVRVHETFIHLGTPEFMSRQYMCPCAGTTPLGIPDSIPLMTQRLVKTRLPWFLECSKLLCGGRWPRHPTGLFPPACLGGDKVSTPPASAVGSSALLNRHALGRTSLIRVMRPAGGVLQEGSPG